MHAIDIETTDLGALFGETLVVCSHPVTQWATDEEFEDTTTFRVDYYQGDEHAMLRHVRDYINSLDIILTWNGKMFDIPFLNARLLAFQDGERVEPHMHVDLMWYAKGASNRVGSAKLVNVQKHMKLLEEKTDIKWDVWKAAHKLESEAVDEVVHHCVQDVKVLGEAYKIMRRSVKNIHK